MDMNVSKLQEIVKDKEAWHTAVHGVTKSRTQYSNEQVLSVTYDVKETETYYLNL